MLTIAILLLSLWISLNDLRTHRIRNSDLLILALPLVFSIHLPGAISALLLISTALVLSMILNIGGGDFKLFSLLVLTQGSIIATAEYVLRFMIAITILVVLSVISRRKIAGSIALAPAILAPFLLGYLGI